MYNNALGNGRDIQEKLMMFIAVNYNKECNKAKTLHCIDVDSRNNVQKLYDDIELTYSTIKNSTPWARAFYENARIKMMSINNMPVVDKLLDLKSSTNTDKFNYIITEMSGGLKGKEHLGPLLKYVFNIDLCNQGKETKASIAEFKKHLKSEQETCSKSLFRATNRGKTTEADRLKDRLVTITMIESELSRKYDKTASKAATTFHSHLPPSEPGRKRSM